MREWRHVKTVDREHKNRSYHMTLMNFKDREDLETYMSETKKTNYVYNPVFWNARQEDDGTWSVDHSCWDSAD